MTLNQMKKISESRDIRQFLNFEFRATQVENEETEELWIEGYATRFNEETVLYSYGDIEYKEEVDSRAFSEADMTDVIFNYNHGGKVIARTRNNTLSLTVDDKGLFMRARVDGTEEGRKLYEEIKGGYIDRMSYSYTVKESSYDVETHKRTITKIKKLYDVSAVDIPAYDTTSLSARSFEKIEDEIKQEEEQRKRLIILSKL